MRALVYPYVLLRRPARRPLEASYPDEVLQAGWVPGLERLGRAPGPRPRRGAAQAAGHRPSR